MHTIILSCDGWTTKGAIYSADNSET